MGERKLREIDDDKVWWLGADYICPINSVPIREGVIGIENSRIVSVKARSASRPRRLTDLGRCVLLPGFINAHTHLELTDAHGLVAGPTPLIPWIEAMLSTGIHHDVQRQAHSVRNGVQKSLLSGVTCLVDICHNNAAWRFLQPAPIRSICCAELLAIGKSTKFSPQNVAPSWEQFQSTDRLRMGLAPHAPTTTQPQVYLWAVEQSRHNGWLLTTHLAETPEEVQFTKTGSGDWREMLERRNVWNDSIQIPHCSPVEYAKQLGLLAAPALLAHVNYLDDQDMAMLTGGRASVVFCPRASAYYGHKGHRFAEMLDRGVNVCLGTDSLASNYSLSILDEMRYLYRQNPALAPATVMAMATTNAARAIGWDGQIGSICPGKFADLVAVPLPKGCVDPLRSVLTSDAGVSAVFINGQEISLT